MTAGRGARDIFERHHAPHTDQLLFVHARDGGADRWREQFRRADGRELFYVSADRRLMAVPTTIGAAFEASAPATLFEMNVRDLSFLSGRRYDVTPDGQRFVVQELTGRGSPSALTVVVNWAALLPKER
jgi:hypothetical protein